jgi:hypothetical protein
MKNKYPGKKYYEPRTFWDYWDYFVFVVGIFFFFYLIFNYLKIDPISNFNGFKFLSQIILPILVFAFLALGLICFLQFFRNYLARWALVIIALAIALEVTVMTVNSALTSPNPTPAKIITRTFKVIKKDLRANKLDDSVLVKPVSPKKLVVKKKLTSPIRVDKKDSVSLSGANKPYHIMKPGESLDAFTGDIRKTIKLARQNNVGFWILNEGKRQKISVDSLVFHALKNRIIYSSLAPGDTIWLD